MEPIGCPETSARNYHCSLRNDPEERSSHQCWMLMNTLCIVDISRSILGLGHCATSRKVPGSIPGVAGDFSCGIWHFHVPWVDSASKNEYQDNPGGKGGRCVRLTTYLLHVPIVQKSWGLNLLETCGPVQVCNGRALPLPFLA